MTGITFKIKGIKELKDWFISFIQPEYMGDIFKSKTALAATSTRVKTKQANAVTFAFLIIFLSVIQVLGVIDTSIFLCLMNDVRKFNTGKVVVGTIIVYDMVTHMKPLLERNS